MTISSGAKEARHSRRMSIATPVLHRPGSSGRRGKAATALVTASQATPRQDSGMSRDAAIGVVGATGAVGRVTLALLRERGYENIRVFASKRSAGTELDGLTVEEATPETLAAGDLDLCLFSVGTEASRELVPHAVRGGAIAIDKSAAYRLQEGVPLVVPEVNGARAQENEGVVANPNCCSIPLTVTLKPLHDAAGLV